MKQSHKSSTLKSVILSILLIVGIVVQTAFAQNKTTQIKAFYVPYTSNSLAAYEKEMRSIYVKYLKTITHIDFTYTQRGINLEDLDIDALSQFAALAKYHSSNNAYDEKVIRIMNTELEKCYKKHKSKIEEAKIYDRDLYKQLEKAASELANKESKNPKKEFESTEQYNQRLKEEEKMFKDSSEARFLKAISPVADYIQGYIEAFSIVFEKYNADKGIYTVASANGKYAGQIKISSEEARLLKEAKNFKINVNPSDVYSVNYDLYVRRAEISYEDKTYIAEFPEIKNMQKIVFRGSELWKENLAMKNVEFILADVVIRLEEERVVISGELTDRRDSRKYKTTEIGKQVWIAENLNFNASNWPGPEKTYFMLSHCLLFNTNIASFSSGVKYLL